MIKFVTLISLLIISLACQGQSGCFRIKDTKIFSEGEFLAETDVLVRNGVIEAIQKELESECETIDGSNKTILPGLVNAHVHAWLPYHLKNAMEHGVYTLHDMHSLNSTTKELKKLTASDGFSQLYGAGYAATVAGGHGTQFGYEVPVIGPDRNCYEFVDTQVRSEVDHIKIIYEPARSTLTIEQVDSLIRRAHYHQKKAVVHISVADDAMKMVRLNADGLVHLWRDRQLTDAELLEMSESGIFVIPTASVIEKGIAYLNESGRGERVFTRNQMLAEILRLHRSGIVLLTGTDPPNFGLDYGESLHHELQLFAEAGLSADEILTCATINPFTAYDRIAPVLKERGAATFFLVEGDPEIDISATTQVLSRWVNGQELRSQ